MGDLQFTRDGDPLPGSDRDRARYGTFPTLASEAIMETTTILASPSAMKFPFRSWAAANAFDYPPEARDFLSRCDSAAEAFFVREFTWPTGTIFEADAAHWPDLNITLRLQQRVGLYRLDAVVTKAHAKLAIEIDGMAFHARKYDQVAADYLRERRITCAGYTVVRFTAQEVFKNATECWRQTCAILERRPFPASA